MQTTIAIALSVVAALLFAVAAVLQERGTQGLPDSGVGFFKGLVQRKVWLLGIAADIAGFAVQAGALAVGSLLLVQPLLVTTLLFALPLAAWTQSTKAWLTRSSSPGRASSAPPMNTSAARSRVCDFSAG